MSKCKYYDSYYDCCAVYSTLGGAFQHLVPCHKCDNFTPITNFDRIKAMNVQELAGMLSNFCHISGNCAACPLVDDCPGSESAEAWEKWLLSEVEDE